MHAPPEEPPALAEVDLRGLSPARERALVAREAAACQASLDLARGPLVRALLFGAGPPAPACSSSSSITWWWTASPGASSPTTSRRATGASPPGRRPPSRPRRPPFATGPCAWPSTPAAPSSRASSALACARRRRSRGRPPARPPGGANDVASAQTVTGALPPTETRALLEAPARYRARIEELLLAALLEALAPWTGREALVLDLEGHGREELFPDVDLSRTVGWFTTLFPSFCAARPRGPRASACARSRRACAVPARGIGFGLLRYASPDPEVRARLAALPSPGWPSTTWASSGRRAPDRRRPSPTSAARPAARAPAAATCSR